MLQNENVSYTTNWKLTIVVVQYIEITKALKKTLVHLKWKKMKRDPKLKLLIDAYNNK